MHGAHTTFSLFLSKTTHYLPTYPRAVLYLGTVRPESGEEPQQQE